VQGIAKQVRRERLLHRLRQRIKQRRSAEKSKQDGNQTDANDLPSVPFQDDEALPQTPPEVHHYISKETRKNNKIELLRWLLKYEKDPAVKVSY